MMRLRSTTITESGVAQARAAAESVLDPLLGRSLGELGMVSEVRARRGGVHVQLSVPVADHQAGGPLETRVREAVGATG